MISSTNSSSIILSIIIRRTIIKTPNREILRLGKVKERVSVSFMSRKVTRRRNLLLPKEKRRYISFTFS